MLTQHLVPVRGLVHAAHLPCAVRLQHQHPTELVEDDDFAAKEHDAHHLGRWITGILELHGLLVEREAIERLPARNVTVIELLFGSTRIVVAEETGDKPPVLDVAAHDVGGHCLAPGGLGHSVAASSLDHRSLAHAQLRSWHSLLKARAAAMSHLPSMTPRHIRSLKRHATRHFSSSVLAFAATSRVSSSTLAVVSYAIVLVSFVCV